MDNIFQINKDKNEETYQYQYYTIFGQHSSFDDDGNLYVWMLKSHMHTKE